MHSFYIDGVNCRTYGIVCSGHGTFDAPERDVEGVTIPGRNGELTIDNKRLENIKVTYPASICGGNFAEKARAARAWLCSVSGYRRLEDDYDPDTFRMARFVSGLRFDMTKKNNAGKVNITFDAMPQRWLKSGEDAVELSADGKLVNPTLFTALPTITLTGDGPGELIINGHTIQISDVGGNVTLNREIRRAYAGTTPRDYTMTGRFDWLGLVPGENTISFSGGITAVSITPRWWTV